MSSPVPAATRLLALFLTSALLILPAPKKHIISVDGARTLLQIAGQMESRLGVIITYEEAPLESPEELEAVRGGRIGPKGPHMVPRGKPVRIGFDEPEVLDSRIEVRKILDQVVRDYHRSRAPGFFAGTHNGTYCHIRAGAFKKSAGPIVEFTPMLDTPVTIPPATRSVDETVSLVLAEVGRIRGIPIVLATVPWNFFIGTKAFSYAGNERARDVLIRTFMDAGAKFEMMGLNPTPIGWALLYDATEKSYYFNAHIVRERKYRT